MKTADEYVAQFNADRCSDPAILKVLLDIAIEAQKRMRVEIIRSNADVFKIINDADQKWRRFTEKTKDPRIRADGFSRFVERNFPDIYLPWSKSNRPIN